MITTTTPALTREEARQLTDRCRGAVAHLDRLLVQVWDGRGWAALGYRSFGAWCAAELPELRGVRLRAGDRQARVAALALAGASVRDMAAATGAGLATIHSDLAGVTRPRTVVSADGSVRQARAPRREAAPAQPSAPPAGPPFPPTDTGRKVAPPAQPAQLTTTIVALLAATGPLTAEEVERRTGRRSSSVAPALHRLTAAGRITHTPGARRGAAGLYSRSSC